MKPNRNNNDVVSREYVEELLKQQEINFQQRLKIQFDHFQTLLIQSQSSTVESPKFCNETDSRNCFSLDYDSSNPNQASQPINSTVNISLVII